MRKIVDQTQQVSIAMDEEFAMDHLPHEHRESWDAEFSKCLPFDGRRTPLHRDLETKNKEVQLFWNEKEVFDYILNTLAITGYICNEHHRHYIQETMQRHFETTGGENVGI